MTIEKRYTQEQLSEVRIHAHTEAGDEDPLDFYGAALDLGHDEDVAEEIDEFLTTRAVRAREFLHLPPFRLNRKRRVGK